MDLAQLEISAYREKWPVKLVTARYADGRPALILVDMRTGEPQWKISVNMPEIDLADGEYIIKTWSENEPVIDQVMGTGLFVDTGRRVTCG